MSEKPFHEEDYRKEKSSCCPIVDILIGKNNQQVTVYVDTGCTVGVAMLQSQIDDLDLGEKINDEPIPILLGDGHRVGADVYKTSVKLSGEEREVLISVIDPTKILGSAPTDECDPVLGRDFLDQFKVVFEGGIPVKKLKFYK